MEEPPTYEESIQKAAPAPRPIVKTPEKQPPPPGFAIPPSTNDVQPQVHITHVTTHIFNTMMGENPVEMVCPYCHKEIVTNVENEPSSKTYLYAAGLCFLGGLVCCWIPFCVNSCQRQDHKCPSCGQLIGQNNI